MNGEARISLSSTCESSLWNAWPHGLFSNSNAGEGSLTSEGRELCRVGRSWHGRRTTSHISRMPLRHLKSARMCRNAQRNDTLYSTAVRRVSQAAPIDMDSAPDKHISLADQTSSLLVLHARRSKSSHWPFDDRARWSGCLKLRASGGHSTLQGPEPIGLECAVREHDRHAG